MNLFSWRKRVEQTDILANEGWIYDLLEEAMRGLDGLATTARREDKQLEAVHLTAFKVRVQDAMTCYRKECSHDRDLGEMLRKVEQRGRV